MPDPGASAAASHGIGLLLAELHKKIKQLKSVREACYNLQRNLKILAAYVDDEIRRDSQTNVHRARSEEVRELVHDIEDCIERYMHRIMCLDDAKWHTWIGGTAKTLFVRNRFAKKIKNLNQRVQQAGVDQIRRITAEEAAPAGGGHDPIQADLVGFAQAKQEVLTLLDEVENEPSKLRVISIVGFGGSGKTTLASAVYRSLTEYDDAKAKSKSTRFPLRAWVDRRHYKDASSLLKRIILEFWPHEGKTAAESSDEITLQDYIKDKMNKDNKRYLIILDDMDVKNLWKWIDLTFKDKGISSRIIVTTTWLPTALGCSRSSNRQRGEGYVYRMRSLCYKGSQTLSRLNEIAHDSCPCHQGQCQCPLESLQKKCDGLPLALVSAAKHFDSRCWGHPTIEDCTTLCKDLGSLLHKNKDSTAPAVQIEPFADLQGVLTNNFIRLADGTLGACCLQYLGISPDARCLKKNKIIRRWVAEGYGLSKYPRKSYQKQAEEIFQKLIDMNIIQPIGISSSPTCKALGIVHEFVLHKSISENFIMTIGSAEERDSAIEGKQKSRHLFVRSGNITSSRATVSMDLSHVRSLTVVTVTNQDNNLGSGSACDGFFEFSMYRLLRVLDLEECTEVDNSHLTSICDLWNLRYLSLGHKVNKLPNEIKQLELLERLHLSKTNVTELPVEIIGMPCLKHLIGRFILLGHEPTAELVENNKLETLSGIVADIKQGFFQLVPRLMNLRKVNICFDHSSIYMIALGDLLLAAIKGYLEHPLQHGISRSLSIDFESLYRMRYDESFPNFVMQQLHHSSKFYYLTSLKLHDRLLSPWPQFVASLSGLTKLSLSLKSATQNLLLAISELQHALEHLKLVVDEIPENLVIQDGKFKNLKSLCFVVLGAISEIQIHGVLPALQSLQLISKFLAPNLCGIEIRNLIQLQEIELHAEVSAETRQEWQTAAMDHPKRPDVLPLRGVDDPTDEEEGAALVGDEAAAIAGAAAAQVDHTPAAIALNSTASEGGPLEGYRSAENLTSVASTETEARAVPVVTTTGNTLGQEPAESAVTTATATSHEPTQIPFACSSTPANDQSPYAADSVASAALEDVADNRLGLTTVQNMASVNNHAPSFEGGKPSENPIDVQQQEEPDASTPAQQPIREASNHAQVNNANNGALAVRANGHGHVR